MSKQPGIDHPCPVRRLDSGGRHHFFGYYNKHIWSPDGSRLLAQQVDMMTGDLVGSEIADLGYFDLRDGSFHRFATTTTWNWQMGCQLQWLEDGSGRRVIYNRRSEGDGAVYPDFVAEIQDLESGAKRRLPLPVYVVSPRADYALSVDYSRFEVTHKTIGYRATRAEPALGLAPADDGIHRLDLVSGEYRLILSLAELREFQPVASMERAIHWATHLEINPAGDRFLFIHRWTERVEDETCFLHRLFTCRPDGSELRLLECTDHPLPQLAADFDPAAVGTFDYEKSEYQISHPAWRDDETVIVWGPHEGSIHYHLYQDRDGGEVEVLGRDLLTENGHMTYSPAGRWLLSDTYPDPESDERLLILYDTRAHRRFNIGSFYTPPDLGKHNRCDLHPRWSRDGKAVCIDSVHEGSRQVYVVDVSELVE